MLHRIVSAGWFGMLTSMAIAIGVPGQGGWAQETTTARPSASLGAIGSPAEKKEPSAASVQSDEVKAFRKTAIAVSFPSDGLMLHGWIYKPKGEGPFPAIIWNHGSDKNPAANPALGRFYTSHGFVVFLPIRAGHNPSPGKYIQDELAEYAAEAKDRRLVPARAVELHDLHSKDVVAALAWLREQPYVDGERVAISGCSYGGIQTLIAAEKGMGVRAFVAFAPGAMSWGNPLLQQREMTAARNAKAPLFLLQAKNDYGLGPIEVLGPIIREKKGLNRATLYPAYGTTPQDGHAGFACSEGGIAVWGADVIEFLNEAGLGSRPSKSVER